MTYLPSTMRCPLALLTAVVLLICSRSLLAHEYWLEPTQLEYKVGDVLTIDTRNGESLGGPVLSLNPSFIRHAGIISPGGRESLKGRPGDLPAIQMPARESGIHLALLESTPRYVTYSNKQSFLGFLSSHALDTPDHKGLIESFDGRYIREQYTRYCKTLINVKPATGPSSSDHSDKPSAGSQAQRENIGGDNNHSNRLAALETQGMRYELTALDTPFGREQITLRLMLESESLVNRQIELYHKDLQDKVVKQTAMTNTQGEATFNISAPGTYLFNSVWIEPPGEESDEWASLWSSLVFKQAQAAAEQK